MKTANLLTQYANVFSNLENRKLCKIESCFIGENILTEELLTQLKCLHSASLAKEVLDVIVDGAVKANVGLCNIQPKHIGHRVKIELEATRIHDKQMICSNWNELLSYPKYIHQPVNEVFFTDTSEVINASSNDSKFNNYLNITNVCALIEEVALQNVTDSYCKIVVYDRDISIKYSVKEDDLKFEVDTELLDDFLHKDAHFEVKTALVKQSLVKLLKHQSINNRLGYLISHFNGFASDLLVSYHSYVENYSFDKVRKEYEEKHTLYVEKVNDVFDRVVTKLLSIPAGVWFANSQIQNYTSGSLEFTKNIAVVVSVCILACLLILNLSGQFSTLGTLRAEYKSLFERLKSDYEKEEINITKVLSKLENQAVWVYFKLIFSLLSTVVLVFLTIFLMFQASQ
jgi:hypothetical protein